MALTASKKYAKQLKAVGKTYNNYYKQYSAQQTAQANRTKATNNATATANVQKAYTNSLLQQKSLNENLARQGITGGASETSNVNIGNNLANVQSGYKNYAMGQNTGVANNLTNALASYKLTNSQNKDTAYQNERKLYRSDKQTALNNRINAKNVNEKRFANTISGYTSKKSIDKAIKSASKHKSTKWKVAYLRAQRATVDQ